MRPYSICRHVKINEHDVLSSLGNVVVLAA
jgi:hypothetical protein